MNTVPILFIGNKTDLQVNRQVPAQEAHMLALSLGCLYAETSAKYNTDIKHSFLKIMGAAFSTQKKDSKTIRNKIFRSFKKIRTAIKRHGSVDSNCSKTSTRSIDAEKCTIL